MKLTNKQLRQIIKEELNNVLYEGEAKLLIEYSDRSIQISESVPGSPSMNIVAYLSKSGNQEDYNIIIAYVQNQNDPNAKSAFANLMSEDYEKQIDNYDIALKPF